MTFRKCYKISLDCRADACQSSREKIVYLQAVTHVCVCVCSVIVLTNLITGNGHTIRCGCCVCIVLCTDMRTSNIEHLRVCLQYCVVCKRQENFCIVIFCARLGNGKCYMVTGSHTQVTVYQLPAYKKGHGKLR